MIYRSEEKSKVFLYEKLTNTLSALRFMALVAYV
jgi:hypothetical protein